MVACALALGACGPALEDEQGDGTEPASAPSEQPKKSGTTDSSAAEFAEPGMVYAQTLVKDLGSAMGSPVTTYANISTATNQWSVSCNGGGSRDIAYVWKAPSAGSYSFSTSNSNFDTVLQIRNYRNTSQVMGCSDDVGSSLRSRITLPSLQKGDLLLIIIEGYAGEYGNSARLNIAKN
ncbi:hypothetical protein [Cystobacter fuscus]|uniref:hypothetical protein n=1 Tax=Cystobacter fuscus TaxID=43 RepID=UPI0005B838ED|nr:hypothetical protein [Cystobacter fuscus]